MHDITEDSTGSPPPRVPSNAPPLAEGRTVTGIDTNTFYGTSASSRAGTRRRTVGPSTERKGSTMAPEVQVCSMDQDDELEPGISTTPEETTTTAVWDNPRYTQPDWGIGSGWSGEYNKSYPDLGDPSDGWETGGTPRDILKLLKKGKEDTWADLPPMKYIFLGYGMLPPLVTDDFHDPEHSLYTVTVIPPNIKPIPTVKDTPATQSTSSQQPSSPPAAASSITFTPPSPEEVLAAVPADNAYYCPKHNGWVIITLMWNTDVSEKFLVHSEHETLRDFIRNYVRITSCIAKKNAGYGQSGRLDMTHHFHPFRNTRHLTPSYVRKPWERQSGKFRTSESGSYVNDGPVEGDVRQAVTDPNGMKDKKADDNDREVSLDVYICCQCCQIFYVSELIPGVIPADCVNEFTKDKEQNPPVGRTGTQYALAGWETILTIIENKLWRGNNKALPVSGKTFTAKVGWNETVQKVFDSMGFVIDNAKGESMKIVPPSTDPSSSRGQENRERLLRAWVEISAYLSDYRMRHRSSLKDYVPHQLHVKVENGREAYQKAIGAHADQLPRGGHFDGVSGDGELQLAWRKLGMTQSTYSLDLLQYAYKAQCRCDPEHTNEYFDALSRIASYLRSMSSPDAQELDLLITQERSRGRYTRDDFSEAVKILGFGSTGDLQVDYDDDVDDQFIARAWRAMVRFTWNDPNGAGRRKDLNEAFRIIAEERNSPDLRELYHNEVLHAMTPEKAYNTLEVPQTVDEEMLITVFSMRIEEKPSQLENMRDALKCIAEFTQSERLQRFLESGVDPGVVTAQTRPDWPRGLNQLGNTCYLNSLLQYFYTIKDLRDAITPLSSKKGKSIEDLSLKDDDLKNHRVGGRVVSRHEVLRSRKFVSELADLFWQLKYGNTPAVTPSLDLAKLALVTSKDEEEDDAERGGAGTDSSNSTDATLVDETAVTTTQDGVTITRSPSSTPPPIPSSLDSNSAEMGIASSPSSILGKRPRGLTRKRTSSGISVPEGGDKTVRKEDYVLVEKPGQSSEGDQGAATPATIDDDGDVEMREASSSSVPGASSTPQKAPPLPPRPKTQPSGSEMMFGKQHDVAECMDNCMFQIETALLRFGDITGSEDEDDKRNLIKRLFYGRLRQRLVNPDSQMQRSKSSIHEREDYFSHLPVNVSEESFDLYDGLAGYFEDTVEFEGKRTQMKVSLVELPPILQIQLQRVQFNRETLQPYKSHAYVKFGETISMDRFLDDAPSDKKERAAEIQQELSKCRERIHELTQSKDGSYADNINLTGQFLTQVLSVDDADPLLAHLKSEWDSVDEELKECRARVSELKTQLEEIWKDEKRAEYELTAVFIHRGSSPTFGHYFIYQRWLPDHPDTWFKYNDSDVSIVSKEEVLADTTGSTANPYLLVFARKGKDVIETVKRDDPSIQEDAEMSLL